MSAMDTDTATMAIELSDLDEEEIQADVIHKLAAELVPQFAVQVLKGNAFSERNKSHIRTALLQRLFGTAEATKQGKVEWYAEEYGEYGGLCQSSQSRW